jgi:nicotinate phosphoribosyltransferase
VNGRALLTDLYELTMLQAYWREQMSERAVFSLHVRTFPQNRNFLLACGLADALEALATMRFTHNDLDWLAGAGPFEDDFLRWLESFRFSGDVYAMPEGTPFFPAEPVLEVDAPIAEAQLAETVVLNQVHLQTVLASKAARVVAAAGGRRIVDFGMRRMHGTDAALKGARAFHIAGVDATSNVLAGKLYGVPIAGTMAHSYIEAHDSERAAFAAFASLYPGTTLLVDTYDTLEGVRRVIELSEELGDEFRVGAVRLDSGDLAALAVQTRRLLDDAGLRHVRIFASGGLDEFSVAELVAKRAPIDAFGVGTGMGVSDDAPALDMAYKLTEYAARGRLKLSPRKATLPGRKQVFRQEADGQALRDVIGEAGERLPGRPLLQRVMRNGEIEAAGRTDLDEARARAERELALLPPRLRTVAPAEVPYDVEISVQLRASRDRLVAEIAEQSGVA